MNSERRKDCPMRHESGNCLPAGGFCTAVSDPICEALHGAYDCGRFDLLNQNIAQPVEKQCSSYHQNG